MPDDFFTRKGGGRTTDDGGQASIPSTKFTLSVIEWAQAKPASRIEHPVSRIEDPVSRIEDPEKILLEN